MESPGNTKLITLLSGLRANGPSPRWWPVRRPSCRAHDSTDRVREANKQSMDTRSRKYLRVGVESTAGWPSKEQVIEHRGYRLTLCPETETLAPSVLFKT